MKLEKKKPQIVDTIIGRAVDAYGLMQSREGIHCTDCIYCLRRAFWSVVDPLPPTPTELLYFLLGLGLQTALLGGDNQSVAEKDGIIISPDIWEDGILGELKTTRMSEKSIDEKGIPDGWIKQMCAYCHVLEVKSCLLIILPIIRPDILSYVLTFDKGEMEENWKDIVIKGEMLRTALEQRKVPELKGEDWQCRSCRYKLRCDIKDGQKKNR